MKPITELTYRISNETRKALRSVIGETMYVIYAPSFSISGSNGLVGSYSFSISIEEGFLNVWTEELDDKSLYWQIHAEKNSTPRNINQEKSRRFKKPVMDNPSSLLLKNSSKLKSIDVYSDHDTQTFNSESYTLFSTVYDHSLVFKLENGDSFCISVNTGEPDSTVVGYDPHGIRILLEDKTKRLTI